MFPHTKPPAGTQINPLHPLSRGLVGCWLFNEGAGSLTNDISGNKNHGRLVNMAPNVQGSGWGGSKFGGGVEFDAVDDYVSVPNNAALDITEAITVSAWVNPISLQSGSRIIVYKGGSSVKDWNYGFWNNSDGLNYRGYVGNGTNYYSAGFGTLSTGVWYHLIMTAESGGNLKSYKNAINEETTSLSGVTITTNADDLTIGSLSYYFNGSIDNVRIYNRTLSSEEIAWSYREPYAMFEPSFNPALLYSAAPPVGAIMNQFQKANIGADLYNGVFA